MPVVLPICVFRHRADCALCPSSWGVAMKIFELIICIAGAIALMTVSLLMFDIKLPGVAKGAVYTTSVLFMVVLLARLYRLLFGRNE